jgi:hypothetical protein
LWFFVNNYRNREWLSDLRAVEKCSDFQLPRAVAAGTIATTFRVAKKGQWKKYSVEVEIPFAKFPATRLRCAALKRTTTPLHGMRQHSSVGRAVDL